MHTQRERERERERERVRARGREREREHRYISANTGDVGTGRFWPRSVPAPALAAAPHPAACQKF